MKLPPLISFWPYEIAKKGETNEINKFSDNNFFLSFIFLQYQYEAFKRTIRLCVI